MVESTRVDFKPTKIDYDKSSRQVIQDDYFDCPICFCVKKDILECPQCKAKACEGCLG